MKPENQNMLLRDAATEPTDEVLEKTLGSEMHAVYKELIAIITDEFGMEYGWRFYKDGKAWLCKVVNKKKTIFWLSLWQGYIKTSFYFTEKTSSGVLELPIDKETKDRFEKTSPAGKLIPLILDIDNKSQLDDLRQIAAYKMKLK